jgi:hypothetical protein
MSYCTFFLTKYIQALHKKKEALKIIFRVPLQCSSCTFLEFLQKFHYGSPSIKIPGLALSETLVAILLRILIGLTLVSGKISLYRNICVLVKEHLHDIKPFIEAVILFCYMLIRIAVENTMQKNQFEINNFPDSRKKVTKQVGSDGNVF